MKLDINYDPLHLARFNMVECQLKPAGVLCPQILQRFVDIPREIFLPDQLRDVAYADAGLVVSTEKVTRKMLTPLSLARMIGLAELRASDIVLDIAAASGYSSAIMAGFANTVISLEADPYFGKIASQAWEEIGIVNVAALCAPLAHGLAEQAPFDVIFINGAVDEVPSILLTQLAKGGRLVVAEAQAHAMRAVVYLRKNIFSKQSGFERFAAFDVTASRLAEFAIQPVFEF